VAVEGPHLVSAPGGGEMVSGRRLGHGNVGPRGVGGSEAMCASRQTPILLPLGREEVGGEMGGQISASIRDWEKKAKSFRR